MAKGDQLPLDRFKRNLLRIVAELEAQGTPIYIVPIRQRMTEVLRREVNGGSIVTNVERLESKGCVSTRWDLRPDKRRGHTTYVTLTQDGRELLKTVPKEMEYIPRPSVQLREGASSLLNSITRGKFGHKPGQGRGPDQNPTPRRGGH